MGKRGTPDHPRQVSAVAEVVMVEIRTHRGRGARGSALRIAGAGRASRRRAVAVLTMVVAISGAVVMWLDDRDPRGVPVTSLARERGPAGVAAAYGFPLGCLSVTILATDNSYARADFNHLRPCGRYTGYPTAIFRYQSGMWRPALDAATYSCPVDSLPLVVQIGLGVCQ